MPSAILGRLDGKMQEAVKAGKPGSDNYVTKLAEGSKNLKEKTSDVLWGIYRKEGYHKFISVANEMLVFKGRDFNDLAQVKGEIAEVVLEVLINQFITENDIDDWLVLRGLILGSENNKKFSTELDLVLITPMIVTIVEIKSFNGEKTLTGDCTLTAVNAGRTLERDIFRQNVVHIEAFWSNFQKYAKGSSGVVKSVLFSFAKGKIIDKREKNKIAIMPAYTEETFPGYLKAVHKLTRNPVWNVVKLISAIEKVQANAPSVEEHLKYVQSLHGKKE